MNQRRTFKLPLTSGQVKDVFDFFRYERAARLHCPLLTLIAGCYRDHNPNLSIIRMAGGATAASRINAPNMDA